ncbi:glycoside hydrolase family 172 protein [Thermotoga sp. Ku-13t]|uniref:glycoside hydrolase family 172 protein n=1 Tax=Thermotoga sp. Ku-13t TaxID=1755813 RepID=UPI0019D1DFB0|nr:glycoside hydrolase family 172 protein [Thermotoga sp. Ku-13t]
MRFEVNSLPVCVNPTGGFNCYWSMPLRKRARITIENQIDQDILHFFYQISFVRKKLEEDVAYFHSQWRRSMTSREDPQHVILNSVEGKGKYVGTVVAWEQLSNGKTYSTAFVGYPLWLKTEGQIPKHVMYRWHIADPIFFKKRLKVIVQALDWWPDGTYQPLTDDITTVAYWYQTEPHASFPELLNLEKRWPR